jgi:hypothetical protein
MTFRDWYTVWAEHADAIAIAYGGSGALKTDFTRTNKRTKKVLLKDGVKSVTRYFKNNFFDGARQVSLTGSLETWSEDVLMVWRVVGWI